MVKFPKQNKDKQALVQTGAMKSKFPQFTSKKKGNNIIFTGDLLVRPELPIYTVSVEYRGDLRPLVKIIYPKLVENPPHFYNSTNSLCLYHSNNFKWNAGKIIAKEIMQWSIAWIFFYEYWLQTGEWIGPEVSHNINKNKYE